MSRDNRSENRRKAKEAANENSGVEGVDEREESIPEGFDLGEMVDEFIAREGEDGETVEEEEIDTSDVQVNAAESENDGEVAKIAAPTDVKKDEAEGKEKEEADPEIDKTKAVEKVAEGEEKPADVKKVEGEAEPIVKPAPTSKEEEHKVLTDEEAAELFSAWRGSTEELLAEHHYRVSDDDIQKINEDPAYIPKFIAKTASKVYLDSISAAFQQFVVYLPKMVGQVIEQRKVVEENEAKFFGEWPDLLSHKDKVLRLAVAYKQVNPTATNEEFINEVGAQAMVALRITPKNSDQKKQEEKPTDKKSFKPAIGSPAGGRQEQKRTKNPFEELVEEFAREAMEDEGA